MHSHCQRGRHWRGTQTPCRQRSRGLPQLETPVLEYQRGPQRHIGSKNRASIGPP
ncbi:MAG: hypothetical protein GY820_11300 [Gammaproteobacteria bacterium]|nr:hypothetical protein [Gammaproteobacteria bacterium]